MSKYHINLDNSYFIIGITDIVLLLFLLIIINY